MVPFVTQALAFETGEQSARQSASVRSDVSLLARWSVIDVAPWWRTPFDRDAVWCELVSRGLVAS